MRVNTERERDFLIILEISWFVLHKNYFGRTTFWPSHFFSLVETVQILVHEPEQKQLCFGNNEVLHVTVFTSMAEDSLKILKKLWPALIVVGW